MALPAYGQNEQTQDNSLQKKHVWTYDDKKKK